MSKELDGQNPEALDAISYIDASNKSAPDFMATVRAVAGFVTCANTSKETQDINLGFDRLAEFIRLCGLVNQIVILTVADRLMQCTPRLQPKNQNINEAYLLKIQ